MELSILDYVVVDENKKDIEALYDTLLLAKFAEKLGYKRFFTAEHHNVPALASTTPELVMQFLLSNTEKIEIGAAGIMLPHYTPYKIAEWIKFLSGVYPKRVNLGIGNNPGTKFVQKAMATSPLSRDEYNEKNAELVEILYKNTKKIHPFEAEVSRLWLLSTSEKSAKLAAWLGQRYIYGIIFSQGENYIKDAKKALQSYRGEAKNPEDMIAVFVVIGEDEKEARSLVRALDIWLLGKKEFSDFDKFPSVETAKDYELNDYEKEKIEKNRQRLVWGTKEQVIEKLRFLERELELSELMCVPLVPTIEKRKKILEVLAEEFLQKN